MRMGREGHMRQRDVTTLLGGALFVSLHVHAAAQEGYFGVGHDRWHKNFYLKLNRNDGKGTCCNLMDCRPTQSRMVGDHYEVKVDGEWTPVPNDKINNVIAPDGGAHRLRSETGGSEQGRYTLRHSAIGGLMARGKAQTSRQVGSHESCAALHR